MPERSSSANPRAEALAHFLSTVLPAAATVRGWLHGPEVPWPHLELTAFDDRGIRVRVTRAQALVTARALIRAFPEAGWQRARTFDLRTAQLGGGA
jgi:hypothetical protein